MTLLQEESTGLIVTRVEALGFRSLRYVSQALGPFQVLVGPNASGKSAFLDVLGFLSDLLRSDIDRAVMGDSSLQIPVRATAHPQLTWMGRGESFELAIETTVPSEVPQAMRDSEATTCRYEIAVQASEPHDITKENFWIKPPSEWGARAPAEFPSPPDPPKGIVTDPQKRAPAGWRRVVTRDHRDQSVTFRSETSSRSFRFQAHAGKSALDSLPAERDLFPAAVQFHRMLTDGVQRIALSSEAMRRTSPPKFAHIFDSGGASLPHLVEAFIHSSPERYADWLLHLREALPDIERLSTRLQPWDGHRYLVVHYRNGLEMPAWLVSDGTVRFLALTLLAYLPVPAGPYLIEEPENGIHPRNMENVLQSLSSIYGAQVLVATHSPDVVRSVGINKVLCLSRHDDAGTDIVTGPAHPMLRNWTSDMDIGLLLGSGILG